VLNLEPIQQEDFERFLEQEIRCYAEDHVRNGNWSPDGALERSRREFERHLPEGIHSRDQHLYSIIANPGRKIGVLWVQVKDRQAFIFDFVIDEAYRGKGYGKQALSAMEEKLQSMNAESVELHVFGDNFAAQELYKKAGFQITDIHMRKSLKQES
jgi:ribosomal protein S18 acetylase RimI-like enzyme